jgi:hypothetical protein
LSLCKTFCPITESAYVHEDVRSPYQLLFSRTGTNDETHHMHLKEADGNTTFDEGYAVGARCNRPQAARANRTVSVAVASSVLTTNVLRLSLTDLYDGGCWQKKTTP